MKELFDELTNTNSKISSSIAFIIGLLLTADLDTAEQNMLGNLIYLIGQTILTNAASQHLIETKIHGKRMNLNSREVKSLYNPVIYDINKVKKIVKELYPNSSEEVELLSKAINDLQRKIDMLKKD